MSKVAGARVAIINRSDHTACAPFDSHKVCRSYTHCVAHSAEGQQLHSAQPAHEWHCRQRGQRSPALLHPSVHDRLTRCAHQECQCTDSHDQTRRVMLILHCWCCRPLLGRSNTVVTATMHASCFNSSFKNKLVLASRSTAELQ